MNRPRPLAYRMRLAERVNQRYRTDPAYRLQRLNSARRRKGLPPLPQDADLPPVGQFRPPVPRNRQRDDKGRFA